MYEFPSYPEDWEERKKFVKKRDNYTCKKCKTKYPPNSPYLRVHHIIPLSKGGSDKYSNLRTECSKCHTKEHPHLERLRNGKNKEGKKNKNYKSGWKRKKFGYFTGKRTNNFKK